MAPYLATDYFVESQHPAIKAFARAHMGPSPDPKDRAVALFYTIRDGWRYNPFIIDGRPKSLKASEILARDYGHCIAKAILLAAVCRSIGIPSRLGFSNVRNHVGTARLEAILQTDVLAFHGYCELYLNGRWIKNTPAFNLELCKKLNVEPLDWDGESDSVFQAYDREKGAFMEYLHDHGVFQTLPHDLMLQTFREHYPHLFKGEHGSMNRSNLLELE